MSATGTNLSAVKAQLQTLLQARAGLAGVNVGYGEPRHADDLTNYDGDLRAIWFGTDGGSDITRPYLGNSVTHEALRFEVVAQAIELGEGDRGDGQQAADEAAEAMLAEVLSELAANPDLGGAVTAPLAALADAYVYRALDRATSAWGARYTLSVTTSPAGIAAPS